ncbi:hypothetical protein WJX84_002752 [Apatococcus fuscideae]
MLLNGKELQSLCQGAVAGQLDMAAAEKSLRTELNAAQEEVTSLQQEVQELGLQQEDLYAAVDRRAGEAARIQRQVTVMAAVRPTHQDEYETLQAELVRLFTIYQSRSRNLDWLESQLEARHKAEAKQAAAANRKLRQVQQKLWEQEQQQLMASEAEEGDLDSPSAGMPAHAPGLLAGDDSSGASTLGESSEDEASRVGSPLLTARPASRASAASGRPVTASQHLQRLASGQGLRTLHRPGGDDEDEDDSF